MSVMAKYARVIWAEPSDDDVAKRNRAVATLIKHFRALTPRRAVEFAGAIVKAFEGAPFSGDLATVAEVRSPSRVTPPSSRAASFTPRSARLSRRLHASERR